MKKKATPYLHHHTEYKTFQVPILDALELGLVVKSNATIEKNKYIQTLLPVDSECLKYFKLDDTWNVDEIYVHDCCYDGLTVSVSRDLG